MLRLRMKYSAANSPALSTWPASPATRPAVSRTGNGKIFYTSFTSLSHMNKEPGHETAHHILNVKLTNKGLGAVIRASGLTTEQSDRYDVLMTTSGNRSELFGEDVYGVSGGEYG